MSTAPRVEHELHSRRRSRNVGLGLVLGAFVFLVMGITYIKLTAQNAELAAERAAREAAAEAQTGTAETTSDTEAAD